MGFRLRLVVFGSVMDTERQRVCGSAPSESVDERINFVIIDVLLRNIELDIVGAASCQSLDDSTYQ